MKTLHTYLVSLAIAGAFAAAAPVFANHPAANPNWGTPVHDERAGRTIVIGAGTKWVNVTGGETIRFVVGGKSFSWLFDTYNASPVFDLDKIAPAGMLDGRSIKVYASPDPLYQG